MSPLFLSFPIIFWPQSLTGDAGETHKGSPPACPSDNLFSTKLVGLYLGWGRTVGGKSTLRPQYFLPLCCSRCRGNSRRASLEHGTWPIGSLQWVFGEWTNERTNDSISVSWPSWMIFLPRITLEKVPKNLIWWEFQMSTAKALSPPLEWEHCSLLAGSESVQENKHRKCCSGNMLQPPLHVGRRQKITNSYWH